ncbi:hypothetical protein FACS1894133_7210 [Clostridia bacterium]|nr:hypothetical protein FACS1894133_7210 [Clostridia bacterium]
MGANVGANSGADTAERRVLIHERSVYGKRVGGDNADEALAKKIHAKLASLEPNLPAFDDPVMTKTDRDNILAACEQIKLNFSSDNGDADIVLRNYCGRGTKNVTMSYNAFAQAIYPVVDSALQVIDEAMEKADLGIDDIDCIILVGGSCQLRLFRELVAEFFGSENLALPEKMQWSVAEGAAITAARGCTARLEEDLCVSLASGGRFPLLTRGTAAPYAAEAMSFAITEDAPHANFVFTNGDGTSDLGFRRIRSKGFLRELINVRAYLNSDLTADFVVENPAMGDGYSLKHTVTNLKYYYEI